MIFQDDWNIKIGNNLYLGEGTTNGYSGDPICNESRNRILAMSALLEILFSKEYTKLNLRVQKETKKTLLIISCIPNLISVSRRYKWYIGLLFLDSGIKIIEPWKRRKFPYEGISPGKLRRES